MHQEVGWRPHEGPQTRFLASPVFEALYGGSRGGGKSDCLLYGGLRQVHHPKYRALILRRTFPELRELIDRSHDLFPRLGGAWVASEKRWVFPSGSTFEFGYGETLDEIQQYRGQQYTYIAYDEIGLVADQKVWLTLLTSIRHTSEGLVKMARCSANPGGKGHGWLRKRFINACPPDGTPIVDDIGNTRAFFQAKVYDNPSIIEKDPQYVKMLESLPDTMRRQELEGDWNSGTGLAFEELNQKIHFVPPRKAAPWEMVFASLDWGWSHAFSVGVYLVQADGVILKMDTITGRKLIPEQIVARVKAGLETLGLGFTDIRYTVSGSDVKIQDKARGNWGPSVSEQFQQYGWQLINADQNRVSGYQNMLRYLTWKPATPPLFRFMDTLGNRKCFDQLESMVVDPDFPNDVLKVDADPLTGEGGDDHYDETRYALMSRPVTPKEPQKYHDRIDRALAKNQEQEKQPSPFTKRHPGITTKDRTERIV